MSLLRSAAPPVSPAVPSGWAGDIGLRMRRHFLLKLLGVSAFMWIFFAAYFHLLRHPARPVTLMPLTALDRAIPFQPSALAAYVSLWLYVGIPPGLMLQLREAVVYGLWIGALCLVGLACFYIAPTAVPHLPLPIDLALHPGFALLQGVDAAGNACPSLHVATAAFSAVWIHQLLRTTRAPAACHLVNAVWLLLIVWSTLAIKQHVALDVLGGALLAALFGWASLRWRGPVLN
jgi:membrane-associated phospholipid phosphatase